jgi:hypothetical protein
MKPRQEDDSGMTTLTTETVQAISSYKNTLTKSTLTSQPS